METFRRYSKHIYIVLCDAVYSKRRTKATGRLIFLRFFKVPLRDEELFFPLYLHTVIFSPFLSFSTLQSTRWREKRV